MTINLNLIGTYRTGIFQQSAAEIPAYDPITQRLFVVNAQSASVDVLDMSDPTSPIKIGEIVGENVGGIVNSVTVKNGIVAVAVEANIKTDPGSVILFSSDGDFSSFIEPERILPAGALPDAITFTPDGNKILVSNEGEPNEDYTIDPEGSVTIIDVTNGIANATVTQVNFNAFDDRIEELRASGVRIFGPGASVSQDLEPEWITVSSDSKTAYVSLQENNAIAILDIEKGIITDIRPLGFRDHNLPGNGIDASDRDGVINIANWPVFGIPQPDTITSYEVNGQTFIVTANEGDARDYRGFSEEVRVNSLLLDPVVFPNAAELQRNDQLGRLTVTNTLGISDRAIFVSELNGEQEVDPVTTDAEGEALLWVDDDSFLNIRLTVGGLDFGPLFGFAPLTEDTGDDVTLIHIHEGIRGTNGGVVWDIFEDPDTEIVISDDGTAIITSIWQENTIPKTLQGEDAPFYFNIHTERNAGGEIRGQLMGEIAYSEIYAYGSRSFSIYDQDINLIFDSGDQFEQIIAEQIESGILPFKAFNANHTSNDSFDTRSDNKGPEPEGIAIGEINGVPYAFIGLERIGGVMVYNISNPNAPQFIQYINNRDFSVETQLPDGSTNPEVGDLGAEGLIFISAEDSPNGKPLLVVANEVSGTTTVFEVELPTPEPFTLQLFHVADQEAGTAAFEDIPRFSAVLNALRNQDLDNDGILGFANTLTLSSGDAYIPGLFFGASQQAFGGAGRGDILIQNELGIQAIAFGNHEFDLGTALVRDLILGDETFSGTNFPYLSSNLDFSTDANLADLVVPNGQAPLPNSIAASVVFDVNGEQVGVVGATTPTIRNTNVTISSPGDVTVLPTPFDGVPTPEQLDALAAEIQADVDALIEANPGLNKVILLSHMQQLSIERELATRLRHVDIIVAGGSNTRLFDENDRPRAGDSVQGEYPIFTTDADGNPVVIVNTDGNYKYVGRLVVDFDENGIIIPESYDPNISGAFATDAQGVADLNAEDLINPEIQNIVNQLRDVVVGRESNIFGISNVFLNGDRNSVRTEETNLGNLTADANLLYAQQFDPNVIISIKNGGGIRNSIGREIVPTGSVGEIQFLPTEAVFDGDGNEVKPQGGISENDIINALSFNNGLSLVTVTAQELLDILEHALEESTGSNTPGRFPQVGGMSFSFDIEQAPGNRIQSLVINDQNGGILDVIVQNGELQGNATRSFRMVTLDFLANGGDGFPIPQTDRVDLVGDDSSRTGNATFAPDGSEQDALAEFLFDNFRETPFDFADTPVAGDTRIQNLTFREDSLIQPVPTPPFIVEDVTSVTGILLDLSQNPEDVAVRLDDDTLNLTDAAFHNIIGLYQVQNFSGAVVDIFDLNNNGSTTDLLNPGDQGYAFTAISGAVNNFNIELGANGDPTKNTTANDFGDVLLEGGKIYAPFIIANGGNLIPNGGNVQDAFDAFLGVNPDNVGATIENFDSHAVAYFSFLGANPDNSAHVRNLGNNVFGFEDLPGNLGVSDFDFNDAVVRFTAVSAVAA